MKDPSYLCTNFPDGLKSLSLYSYINIHNFLFKKLKEAQDVKRLLAK